MAKKFSFVTNPSTSGAGDHMSNLNDPRVLFAAERTLLAWNRTSLALSAFGFMIERSGVLLRILRPEAVGTPETVSFLVGLAFILLGAFCAFYSALQYGEVLKTLNDVEIPTGYRTRWGMVINWLVALVTAGLAVALTVYARP